MGTKVLNTLYLRAPKLNQLNILNLLARDAHITQAELARLCDLSVAMVNNYMRELCSLGLLEYRRKSSKSVSYHVTSRGRDQVEALEIQLVEEMVGLFAEAKARIRDRILCHSPRALRRVVLFGSGNLAQITFHALELAGVSILGICDDSNNAKSECCGRQIMDPSQIRHIDPNAVIIVDQHRIEEICSSLSYLQDRGIQLICLDGPPCSPRRDKNGSEVSSSADPLSVT